MNLPPIKKVPDISVTILKIVAIISMTIDHIAAGYIPYSAYSEQLEFIIEPMSTIGRLAFPLYIFLLVEGFMKTRSRLKYLQRLIILFIVSQIPFEFVIYSEVAFQNYNVIATLIIGFIAMLIYSYTDSVCDLIITKFSLNDAKRDEILPFLKLFSHIIAAFLAMFAEYCHTDYGEYGVLAIYACYVIRKNNPSHKYMMLSMIAIIIILVNCAPSEIYAFPNILLVAMYNDSIKPVKSIYIKKMLNYYYPGHLIIISIIKLLTCKY